jgi:hypothetical protein
MSYVQSFKKFANAEKKAAEEVVAGANPAIAEQATPATQAVQTTPADTTVKPVNPATAAAQKQVTDTDAQIAALNAQIAALQAKRATAQAAVNAASAQPTA